MKPFPMNAATIRDVAKKAGVGLATVSRVINDSPLVSEATRQRVLAVIEELNYIPNPSARRLSLKKTLTIATIAPFFTRPSITERLRGIESILAGSEYDLIIHNIETIARRDSLIFELTKKKRVDGILIISLIPNKEGLDLLMQSEVPVVFIDAIPPSENSLSKVVTDDIEGGYKATNHLISLGHQRIAIISDLIDNPFKFTSSRDRLHGYRLAMKKSGIQINTEYHCQANHGSSEACELSKGMLALPEPPTAIFATSDTLAMGVMEAARDLGLEIPRDLSVIGYDDVEFAKNLGLTTIRQLLFESGQRGVEILLDHFENPQMEPIREVLPTELIIRITTSPLPV